MVNNRTSLLDWRIKEDTVLREEPVQGAYLLYLSHGRHCWQREVRLLFLFLVFFFEIIYLFIIYLRERGHEVGGTEGAGSPMLSPSQNPEIMT